MNFFFSFVHTSVYTKHTYVNILQKLSEGVWKYLSSSMYALWVPEIQNAFNTLCWGNKPPKSESP